MLNFSFKLLSLLLIILNTILALPFYNIFLATIYCRSDSAAGADLGCYAGIHILHMIVAIIGIVLLVFFHFSTTLLYFDLKYDYSISLVLNLNFHLTVTNLMLNMLECYLSLLRHF